MNKVVLLGRPTTSPEIKYSNNGENSMCIARFCLAVDRRGKQEEGKQSADFIMCKAFGKTTEWCEKYIKKGVKVAVIGRIQSGSYLKQDGTKVYTTDVLVEECDFAERTTDTPAESNCSDKGMIDIPDGIDDEIPFN